MNGYESIGWARIHRESPFETVIGKLWSTGSGWIMHKGNLSKLPDPPNGLVYVYIDHFSTGRKNLATPGYVLIPIDFQKKSTSINTAMDPKTKKWVWQVTPPNTNLNDYYGQPFFPDTDYEPANQIENPSPIPTSTIKWPVNSPSESYSPSYSSSSSPPPPKQSSPTYSPSYSSSPQYSPSESSPSSSLPITSILMNGSKGSEVKWLQTTLNTVFNSSLKVDGDFGSKTEKVVKDFQKSNGIVPNGVVDATMRVALTSGRPPVPVPGLTQQPAYNPMSQQPWMQPWMPQQPTPPSWFTRPVLGPIPGYGVVVIGSLAAVATVAAAVILKKRG